mgnify:FL=1
MEASRIADLFKLKSMFRYWKKGIVLGLLYGIVWTLINAVMTWILGAMGIQVTTLMGAIQVGGIAVVVTIIVGLVLQGIVAGFLVEYINNTKNRAIKWVQK